MQHYPLVTIVGGSGFVGRHTVKAFAQAGYRVRVLVRDTVAAEFLKTIATVGQIYIEHVDITRPESLVGKCAGSDVVVSLVSIMYQSGRQKFDAINVAGARAVAQEARRAGAKALVHVSALGVEKASDTRYGATKFAGEQAVRAEFPGAVILRPSLIVGPEDNFFQRFARMSMLLPMLPLISGGETKFQPVLVTDVAKAILVSAQNPLHAGQTISLGGPQVYSFRALLELMGRITGRHPRLVKVPACVARMKGFFCELLPLKPLITRDQVKLLAHDNVVAHSDRTFADLGIVPTAIEAVLPGFLARYVKA